MYRPKIIYIMGCGRSGTTILDLILGSHSAFLSLGQINRAKIKWNERTICSCGVPVCQCRIWKPVGNIFFDDQPGSKYRKILSHQRDIERNMSILKHILGSYDPCIMHEYYSYIYGIFKMLTELSSTKVIIDSSKSVGRASALMQNPKLDVKIIHLVRDPRGVYFSFQKKDVITPSKNLAPFLVYWNSVNLLASALRIWLSNKKVLRIRYEDLISQTNDTIDTISKFINEDLSEVKKRLIDGTPIERGHLASGNRVVNQESPILLQPDLKWMKMLKAHQRLIIATYCLPLMLAYRYIYLQGISKWLIEDK